MLVVSVEALDGEVILKDFSTYAVTGTPARFIDRLGSPAGSLEPDRPTSTGS
jgi:hypothetical protein